MKKLKLRKIKDIVNTIKVKRMNEKTRKMFLIVMLLLLFFTFGITYGRYIYKEIRNYYLSTKNFYFNSDKLKENMARYQIDNWSGVDSFTVTINLNSMKNNLVGAESDIVYNLNFNCSNNVQCSASKMDGVILASSHTDYFTITLTPSVALKEGDTVTAYIEANATEPYTKKISCFFTINIGIPGLSYEISDVIGRPYLLFNITNTLDYYTIKTAFDTYSQGDKIDIDTYLNLTDENKNNCASAIITLKFDPDVVILDMTSSAYLKAFNIVTTTIDGYEYIKQISFKVDALSSEVVNFYKSDTSIDYTYPFVNDNPVIDFSYEI